MVGAYAHAQALLAGATWNKFGGYKPQGDEVNDWAAVDLEFTNLHKWATPLCKKKHLLDYYKAASEKYADDARNPFEYRFDAQQLERLQQLVNEVREQLQTLEGIPESWRRRMLRRLEALQKELHERMSSMDRFWGIVGEGVSVLYQIGVAATPLVNRLREMAEIGLRVHAQFFGLPVPLGVPILPPSEDDPECPSVKVVAEQTRQLSDGIA